MIQLNAVLNRLATLTDHFAGDTNDCRAIRHFIQNNGISPDHRIVANAKRTKNFGACADQNIVAQCRMPFAFFFTGAAKAYSVINRAVIADLGCLADDNP